MLGDRQFQSRAQVRPFAQPSVSVWVASLACLALIIGGLGQWATAFGFMSLSGTSMHGWNEVGVGVLGLSMLTLHRLSGARLPLIVAATGGALGAIQAVVTLVKLAGAGSVTVLGIQYRFVNPSWGLYLVLAGAIALAASAAVAWLEARATR